MENEPNSSTNETSSSTNEPNSSTNEGGSCLGQIFSVIAVLASLNFGLFGFGKYIGPIIWRSEIDRACQEEGYWYGSESGTPGEIVCHSWFVKPKFGSSGSKSR